MIKAPVIDKAKTYCEEMHEGQKRKFTGCPYYVHPRNTAKILQSFTDDPELIAVGYLHDVIEDTDITRDSLEKAFNERIASLVSEVTNDEEKRKELGKKEYMKQKVLELSEEALLVKLADRFDNVNDFDNVPEDFEERYSQETKEVLDVLEEKRELNNDHEELVNRIRSCIR